ncbi:MAG: isochorismatase family protein [Desulfobacterales bacterium]|jgi:nicotinamidase-related amidase|nr:isochorismatase family protein [Desulfobacterales bacterium]
MPVMEQCNDILSATDREVIRQGGYGKRRGFGKQPVLMIIDPQYNYTGDDKAILDQIEEWPSGVGESAWLAVDRIRHVLAKARSKQIPIIFTRHIPRNLEFDSLTAKTERDRSQYLPGAKGTTIITELSPEPGEWVIDKSFASAFYGTPLLSYLIHMKTDTLLVTGGTTSGCVRAFCVDAVSNNFNVAVLEDCVYDRISVSHKIGLLDLWMKYCDVIESGEALTYLDDL